MFLALYSSAQGDVRAASRCCFPPPGYPSADRSEQEVKFSLDHADRGSTSSREGGDSGQKEPGPNVVEPPLLPLTITPALCCEREINFDFMEITVILGLCENSPAHSPIRRVRQTSLRA